MRSLLALQTLTCLAAAQTWSIGQAVRTSGGHVVGKASDWKPAVSEYLGIPFAQPPVGELRFAAPRPFNGAKHVDATKYGFGCPENVGGAAKTQESNTHEDCLTLNV